MAEHIDESAGNTDASAPESLAEECPASYSGPHLWTITWVRDLFYFAFAITTLALVWWLRAIFQPVMLALLMAYLLNPILIWCQQRVKWSRLTWLSILFATAATLLLVLGIVLVPILAGQASALVTHLPDYAEGLADKAGIKDEDVRQEIRDKGEALMRDPVTALSYLWDGVATSVGMVTGVVGTATSMAMGLGLFPVYLFVFLWRWPAIAAWPVDYIPSSRRARCLSLGSKMDQAIGGYFRTRLVIASVMGVLYSLGWGIAGVPYWLLIGILGGLLGIIPYASGLAWLAAMLLRYLDLDNGLEGIGDVLAVFLWPTIVYAVVQESDDWIMTPLLQGNQLNMNFITIILAVFVGGAVAGLFGMFMAVPAAACIQIYWTESLSPRLKHFAASS